MQQRPASSTPELTTSHEVPTEVVQEKLDSALLADLDVAPAAPLGDLDVAPAAPLALTSVIDLPLSSPVPPDPPRTLDMGAVAGLVSVLLGLLLVRWVGVRWAWLSHAVRSRLRPSPGHPTGPTPRREAASEPRGPERRYRPGPASPKRQDPILLPPHVAAILARIEQRPADERRASGSVEGRGRAEDAEGVGLDIWIGR